MGLKTVEVSIDGKDYRITQLPFGASQRLLTRLMRVVGPVLAELAAGVKDGKANLESDLTELMPTFGPAVEKLCASLGDDDLDFLFKTLAGHSEVSLSEGKWVNLKDVMEMEFAGEFPHAIKWLVESLKVNFGNFFGDRGLLGRAGAPAKEKAAPSQKA